MLHLDEDGNLEALKYETFTLNIQLWYSPRKLTQFYLSQKSSPKSNTGIMQD